MEGGGFVVSDSLISWCLTCFRVCYRSKNSFDSSSLYFYLFSFKLFFIARFTV
jgi:hypothetical protein